MSDRIKFLMTFRARLMLLLTSFLMVTVVLVIVLDNWARKRADAVVAEQSLKVKEAFNDSFHDFSQAISIAIDNLSSQVYLYDKLEPGDLPATVQHIIVTDATGLVTDSDIKELINQQIFVPARPEGAAEGAEFDPVPVEGEVKLHGGITRTYNIPTMTGKGLYWVVIVINQEALSNQVDAAQITLATVNRQLSNYRLAVTSAVLLFALAIAVVIGWRFTHPINELAGAARRVAAGELDFRVDVNRPDEVGQLANTFNEMIAGLKSKRELEEKLNHAERAAVIGRLTQAVAHEIRNPLNVINLSIDHVSTKFAPEDETKRKQFTRILSSLKDEIARLKYLVSDLLNLGRPAQLTVKTVDMRELVAETISLLKQQADEQGVEVALDEGAQPAEVRADRERLKSCLSNIAINALQAMPGGGRLTARVERLDGTVEVSISDTGVGINEESLGKIFEPYFSTKQSGFGLGLAVTKKIIEEHKGTIDVSSKPDHGTTFKVKLPAADE